MSEPWQETHWKHWHERAVSAEAKNERLREATTTALGLIQTASSRARILQARDVLSDALSEEGGSCDGHCGRAMCDNGCALSEEGGDA